MTTNALKGLDVVQTAQPMKGSMTLNILKFAVLLDLLMSTVVGLSGPLDTWTWLRPPGNTLNAVTHGNGLFCAVGNEQTILTSTDGTNWVLQPLVNQVNVEVDLWDVAAGAGLFFALGHEFNLSSSEQKSIVMSSPDGSHWAQQDPNTTNLLASVSYGAGRFVAVGDSGTILSSADGTNWIQQQAGVTNDLRSIVFANQRFVAVGDGGGVLTSVDGTVWSANPSGTQARLESIAYGAGQFVVMGWAGPDLDSGSTILTSGDGTNWMEGQTLESYIIVKLAYGNNTFVGVGANSSTPNALLISTNGFNWDLSLDGKRAGVNAITFAQDQFVAVGVGTVLTATDGVNWVVQPGGGGQKLGFLGMTYGGGQFAGVGQEGILTSTDAVNWVQQGWRTPAAPYFTTLEAITYENGLFVAVGESGRNYWTYLALTNIAVTSTDGVYWVQNYVGASGNLYGIAYGGGQFVAVGGSAKGETSTAAAALFASSDGVHWVERQPATTNTLLSVAYGNGQFVAVGGNYKTIGAECAIVTSHDGVNWVQRQPGLTNTILTGVTYGNGLFVGVAMSGNILTSADGVTWVVRPLDLFLWGLSSVAYGNGQFVVTGYRTLATSSDGLNWFPHAPGTDGGLGSVVYGDGHFLVGGILESGSIISLSVTPNASTGLLSLSLSGPTGLAYTVQSSTDLATWRNLTNLTTAQPTTVIPTALNPTSGQVFYRAYAH